MADEREYGDFREMLGYLRATAEQLVKGQDRLERRQERLEQRFDRLLWGMVALGAGIIGTLITVLVTGG